MLLNKISFTREAVDHTKRFEIGEVGDKNAEMRGELKLNCLTASSGSCAATKLGDCLQIQPVLA